MMNRTLCNERREYMRLHPSIAVYTATKDDDTDIVTSEGHWHIETVLPERLHKAPRKSELEWDD